MRKQIRHVLKDREPMLVGSLDEIRAEIDAYEAEHGPDIVIEDDWDGHDWKGMQIVKYVPESDEAMNKRKAANAKRAATRAKNKAAAAERKKKHGYEWDGTHYGMAGQGL